MERTPDTSHKHEISRRGFLRTGASAAVACTCMTPSLLHTMKLTARAEPAGNAKTYVCPPCGLPCDKLTFDQPGTCPNCGMTLVPADGGEGGPPRVGILLFNGAELIDFAGPWEVFGTAGLLIHTVAEKQEMITAVFGEKIIPDYTFDNSPKADVLLVPGGGVFNEAIKNARLIQWIQKQASDAKHVMSVCTGAFLLQKAGLLAGQTVTATYGMIDDLAAADTKVVYDKRFVDNGKLIMTAGLSAGIDGALHLVSRLLGTGVAQAVALDMEYNWDPNGTFARAALADRFLPDGLAYARAKVKGLEAKLFSTAGNRDEWETKILVSKPRSSSEVLDVIRNRIAANGATSGMVKPVSHIRGTPLIIPSRAGESKLNWRFTDDEGYSWHGLCTVEPSPAEKDNFVVTFKLGRERRAQQAEKR